MSQHPLATPEPDAHHPSARVFVPALVAGWAIIGFGIHSALRNPKESHPFALLVHVITFDLGHDIVVAPLAFLAFSLAGRFLPTIARGPVRAAIAASVLFTVFSIPLIHRWGQRPTNSSTLPLPYGRNVGIVLAVVWAVALATIAVRATQGRAQNARTSHPAEAEERVQTER